MYWLKQKEWIKTGWKPDESIWEFIEVDKGWSKAAVHF